MKINLKNGEIPSMSKEFPMNVFEIRDTLDRLKIPDDKPIVEFSISEYDNMELPYTLCRRDFSADIYRLNLFAERLKNLDFSGMTAFKSLLIANPECSFEDMLMMTYGLDSVMIYPCRDCCELGETVIENEMLPEVESCSDEILELLDREKVGRLMQKREGGVFIDGHYCVTSGYEPPDINIEIGRPEKCFFRLLIAPSKEQINQAQWVDLPCNRAALNVFAGNFDMQVENMICLEFQSALPRFTETNFGGMENMDWINSLAGMLSRLSHADFVKLKAVMELEKIDNISGAINCIDRLSEYQFDRNIFDQCDFGRAYLLKNIHKNFDCSAFKDMNLCDFGQVILERKKGEITSYGAISGRGQELYSPLTIQAEQQLSEDLNEDFEIEIGGISL